ncbi:amidohydrolase [Rugamonas sp.]|uniref:amidohydrolase n=1 Tax=Rugamonas sp. TaxID=1926287 RepID=UPI0025E213B8|nr:amidohydrolase [Rugamonas sp.]
MMAQVDAQLEQHYAHLDALYKEIHQHPELAFQETATAAKLAKEMRALGFEVTERVGKTGLVAVLRHGDGPTVMVRTELDALPMEEKTGLPYASHVHAMWNGRDVPVAHTCRHDVHMAAWIGTAQVMAAMKAQWRGTLMFIAQPAEETGLGAQAMIDDGLFTRFGKPDIGCALHVVPAPAGVVIYGAGMATSNMDSLEIIFRGRGGHGAAPDAAIDPVLEAGRFIVDVQSVVSREKDPAAFGVVTIGALQAGSVGNIIPDQAELRGTIRSYDLAVREKMLAGVKRTANAVADMAGAARPEVVIGREAAKAVVNDGAISARTGQLFQSAFGKDVVPATKPTSASEDYSAFIAAGVPSLFFGIGALDLTVFVDAKSGKPIPSNHSPYFAPLPEPTIRRAVEAMSLAILGALQQ